MRKLTRRSYNRKLIMLGLALFLSVGLISTGFSAWLISSVTGAEATPPVTAGSISDKAVKVEFHEDIYKDGVWNSNNVLHFDASSDDNEGRVKYVKETAETDETSSSEKLTMLIKGTLSTTDGVGALTLTIDIPKSIYNAINAGYIKIVDTNKGERVVEATGNTAATETVKLDAVDGSTDYRMIVDLPVATTFEYTLTFAWSEYFANMNPCYFYDNDEASVTRFLGYGEAEEKDGGLTAEEKTSTGKALTDEQVTAEMNGFHSILTDGAEIDAPYSGTIKVSVNPTLN